MAITFIVSTCAEKGRTSKFNSQVNTHTALVKYARRRGSADSSHSSTPKPFELDSKCCKKEKIVVRNEYNADGLPVEACEYPLFFLDIHPSRKTNSLDPFVRLPNDITPHEEDLLHFYLSDGRQYAMGTSSSPVYCPALHAANHLQESSLVYLYTHLCMAESMACKLSDNPYSTAFHARAAKAYRAMNDLLSDKDASFHQKLFGFTQITTFEFVLGRPNLLAKHVDAMDKYIHTNGGLEYALEKENCKEGGRGATLDLAFLLSHFLYAEVPIPSLPLLEEALSRFVSSLRHVRAWIRRLSQATPPSDLPRRSKAQPVKPPCNTFPSARGYLNSVVSNVLSAPDSSVPFSHLAGTFHGAFSMCMSQVAYKYSAAESLKFLERIDFTVKHSAVRRSWSSVQHHVNMTVATGLIGRVRCQLTPGKDTEEIELFQIGMDVVRLLPLLSVSTRLKLAAKFAQCAFFPADRHSEALDCFDDQMLDVVSMEALDKWMEKQLSLVSPQGLSPSDDEILTNG